MFPVNFYSGKISMYNVVIGAVTLEMANVGR